MTKYLFKIKKISLNYNRILEKSLVRKSEFIVIFKPYQERIIRDTKDAARLLQFYKGMYAFISR